MALGFGIVGQLCGAAADGGGGLLVAPAADFFGRCGLGSCSCGEFFALADMLTEVEQLKAELARDEAAARAARVRPCHSQPAPSPKPKRWHSDRSDSVAPSIWCRRRSSGRRLGARQRGLLRVQKSGGLLRPMCWWVQD